MCYKKDSLCVADKIEQFIDYTPLLFYNFAIDKKKGG